MVLAAYEGRLASGKVEIKDLVVSKRITKEPRDYQKASVTAIVAQQLFGSGVNLRPGQNIGYIITDSDSAVPNDRVRAFALWEGWFGYDRKKYAAMLREAFEPFVQCAPTAVDIKCLNEPFSEEELKRFPLFAPWRSSVLEAKLSLVALPPDQSSRIHKTTSVLGRFPTELSFSPLPFLREDCA
jgi:hypothetical protein